MIFVTVGNATQPFPRLLTAVDELARQGFFQDRKVRVQRGHNSDFQSPACEIEDFLPMHDFIKAVREAELVISHAGAGTLFHVMQSGKVPLVMPRRMSYGEIVDDHQMELVNMLASHGRVIPVYHPADLSDAVIHARSLPALFHATSLPPLLPMIDRAIKELTRSHRENARVGS